ncbi:MAG: RES family NAD+ phosphorylase [Roseiarcus sp.]
MSLTGPASRGPSGRASLPPTWLHTVDLPIDPLPAGAPLFRVHRLGRDPVFFGPGGGVPPTYRFDSASGAFGVLYVALTLAGAVVETLLRNPARRMVDYPDVATRASSEIRAHRVLRLARLHGTGLQQIGCDNAISTGPYEPCGAWADALWAHPSAPDGIAFQSRHDSSEICLALFERPDLGLKAGSPTALIDQLPTISNLLSAHGKSITGLPP